MEKEKNNNTIKVILVVLLCLVISAVSFVLGGKFYNATEKEPTQEPSGNQESPVETTNNDEYFDSLLEIFLPQNSANNFMRSVSEFTNDDISLYLFFYYSGYANKNNVATNDSNGNITYNVNKTDIDALVYKVFGKSATEYEIPEAKGRTGIKKIDDNTYQVYWFASGWSYPNSKKTNVDIQETTATVEYELTGTGAYDEEGKTLGTLKFYLTKNGENWNVTKIEYKEA